MNANGVSFRGCATFLLAAALVVPSNISAQTCGWDAVDIAPDGVPYSVAQLASRTSNPTTLSESLEQIRSWIRSCDDGAMRRAIFELRGDADRRRGDHVLNALAGIALARGPEVQVEGSVGYLLRATYPNSNAERDAVRRLSAVVERTGWPEVASELTALALATRSEFALDNAYNAVVDLADESPEFRIHAAELALARGDLHGARDAARRVTGPARSSAQRVSAIADLVSGIDTDRAAAAYLAAIDSADDDTLRRYYDDLIPLLTDGEIDAYAKLQCDERAQWLRRAWEWRASISTLSMPSRLAVHFARMDTAFARYRRLSFREATGASMWLMGKLPPLSLDDRGIVYIRHGAPDDMVRVGAGATPGRGGLTSGPSVAREAWLYRWLAGGRAILEFSKSPRRPDYFLLDPVTSDCDPLPRTRAAAEAYEQRLWEFGRNRGRSLGDSCSATFAGDTTGRFYAAHVLRRLAETAVFQTESAQPRFSTPIDAIVQAYAMKRGFDSELVSFLWIDGADLTPRGGDGRFEYTLPLFVAAEDHVARRAVRVDTMVRIQTQQLLQRGSMVRAMIGIDRAPMGELTVRASVRNENDADQGQILVTHKVVPEFRSGFMLSDIVIADTVDGPWVRGPVALVPLPAHRVAEQARFRLYYELYGINPGETVNVQIVIAPVGRSGIVGALRDLIDQRRAVSIDFSDTPGLDDGIARIMQEIEPNLEPGEYSVEVTVTRATSGEAVTTSTSLVVVER